MNIFAAGKCVSFEPIRMGSNKKSQNGQQEEDRQQSLSQADAAGLISEDLTIPSSVIKAAFRQMKKKTVL